MDGVLVDPLHLKGEQLNFTLEGSDLALLYPIVGVPIPPPPDKVLPNEPFSLEKVRAANADIRFKGEKIVTENTPLEKMDAHLIVKDGKVTLAPLDFGVAGGNLVTRIEMDARQQRIATHADITAKGLSPNGDKKTPGIQSVNCIAQRTSGAGDVPVI